MRRRRPDGTLAYGVPDYRRIMPYLMQTKNTSAVYFKMTVDMENMLSFLERLPPETKKIITPTTLVLRSLVKTLDDFPRLNRYVSGRRIYQREEICLSFSAKKAFADDAPLVIIKMRFDPKESLEDMARRVHNELNKGRGEQKSYTDKETALVLKLPRFMIRLVVTFLSTLDYFNLLPRRFIEGDLFYASVFVANLGSIGLEAAYHHLYEYGNVPVFLCIGKIKPMPVVRDGKVVVRRMAEVKITYDERIEDGFYAAHGLERFQYYLEHPEEM